MGAWIPRTLVAEESVEAALERMVRHVAGSVRSHVHSCCHCGHFLEDSIEEGREIFYRTLRQKERERRHILSTGDLDSEFDSDSGCREEDLA